MGNGSGLSRGDRRRNARLTGLREIVSRDRAVIGIDLADDPVGRSVDQDPSAPGGVQSSDLGVLPAFHHQRCHPQLGLRQGLGAEGWRQFGPFGHGFVTHRGSPSAGAQAGNAWR